jgi:hypothetical protein
LAQNKLNQLLTNPEAMTALNKHLTSLDESVVKRILGVSKQDLIDSYKTIVPGGKEAPSAMNKPLTVDDLSEIIDEPIDLYKESLAKMQVDDAVNPYAWPIPEYANSFKKKVSQNFANTFYDQVYNVDEATNQYPLINLAKASHDIGDVPIYAPGSKTDIIGIKPNAFIESAGDASPVAQLKKAISTVNAAPKGRQFIGASSLSTDSYALTLDAALPYVKKGRLEVKVDIDPQVTNSMGYATRFPGLALKDINSKIEAIEKASGVKIPRAKYNKDYNEYDFPRIYFTKIKKNGGYIDRAKHGKQLVKLDQLTNFTNYNKPQPGGWLNKYN